MSQIERLCRQLELEQRRLNETREAIASVSRLLEGEKQYTEKLVKDSQKKTEAIAPQNASQKVTPSKAEKIAKMTDEQLLTAMQTPEKMEQLFKDL